MKNKLLIALAIVRIMVGVTFILHGAQKVFGLFGGPGLHGFAQWAAGYSISPSLAYIAAFAEFIGGVLLTVGVMIHLGGAMVIGVMLGAIFLIHGTNHYFIQNNGFEYPFVLTVLTIALMIAYPVVNPLLLLRKR